MLLNSFFIFVSVTGKLLFPLKLIKETNLERKQMNIKRHREDIENHRPIVKPTMGRTLFSDE